MYVKLFNRILDSSLAENRKLRHFFVDLLLCSDADGNVLMTKEAIARRIRADISEVDWGLDELLKPEVGSLNPEHEGRRLIPLEGHGYGWKIVNFEFYRDMKNAQQLREASAERVRRHRAKKKAAKSTGSGPLPGETLAVRQQEAGHLDENFQPVKSEDDTGLKVTRAFES